MTRSQIRRATALGSVVAVALSLAACGGDEEPATPAAGGANTTTTATGAATASATAAGGNKTGLAPGDEAAIKGLENAQATVVMSEITDPMKSPKTERPKPGKRFVAVQIEITNDGEADIKDSLLNGSRLVTEPADAANPSIVLTGKCKSKPAVNFRLAAGASKKLCLPFQVDKKAKVTGFKFTLNSGYGPESAEWTAAG
jgi:hypothetical protein